MKNLFTILNLFLIAAMAYYIVDKGYEKLIPQNLIKPDQRVSKIDTDYKTRGKNRVKLDRNLTNTIVKRNLFKVEIEPVHDTNIGKKEKSPEKLAPTKLELILWGTVTGRGNVYAVIEDKKARKQDLYQTGDTVQGAKLKEVLRNRVILSFNGKDQFLEMQADSSNITKSKNIPKLKNFQGQKKLEPQMETMNIKNDIPMPDNPDSMMGQIKFRPHFSQGEADGLMAYGIKPNSVFRRIGLRNGDIIKDINGVPIISKDDVSHLLDNVEPDDNLKLTLFRRGKIKELSYTPFTDEDGKGEKE